MFAPRAIASPLTRAAFRPQTLRIAARPAYLRTQVALNSTISEAITKDHRKLETYYKEIINNPDDIDHATRYGNQFTWELARHSVAEELLVYPAMEKYMGAKGKAHAELDRKQHHEVKILLKEFQNMDPASSSYIPKLKQIWSLLKVHIAEEEGSDLPALEAALSSAENRGNSESLAKNFARTKMFVPSRSHPSAGENPYFEGPMGMLAAPIDHIADIFRKFPEGTVSPNPSKK
ncbi:hypothetical protein J4E83_004885 [Alternaria metachromatica]|uniref:uncharacterized protein n=1 Tax=Alternaria metachromatica TaxID=283354 RepID=UPI0020C58BAC|nr:uncharacterized protein J4E83_004885 [Alternaria metachromatica]XP_049238743.1 uncharacterized protein J4E84_010978 [Alternaria hordeiaustralica]KAI4622145.1 hypothetical protein J4E83_004885 [Alternaria metachromatica]KAI4673747.1 hypothetical protein J4E84_010978 [Alternaria hordeiaustralica]